MKKAFVYKRVSTDEQAEEGKSLETQERICRRWAKDNDYIIVEVFSDEGKSATSLNRPALQDMLAKCQEKGTVDAVIVLDTDRLARNTFDHLTIKSMLKKKDATVISVNQLMLDDSPEGNLMDTMIASFNAFQSQITGRKTSKVLEEKAKLGWWPGGTPRLGYHNALNPHPTSTLDRQIVIPTEEVYPYILKVFEMYDTGNYNIYTLADYLNKKGIKAVQGGEIQPSVVATLLKDEFYIGKFMWNKKQYEGKHILFVPKELFIRVQNVIQTHNQNATRKRKHNFLLRGFLGCADCSRRILGERHVKSKGTIYDLYFCPTCKKETYIDRQELELKVEAIFKKIEISDDYVQAVLKRARELLDNHRISEDSEKRRLLRQRVEVEKAMEEAEDSRFKTHTLSEEAFLRVYPRYESQLKEISDELEKLQLDHSKNIQTLEEILKLAENIGQAYHEAEFNEKRNYLGLFFKDFKLRKGKIVRYRLSDDLKPLIENGSVRLSQNGLPRLDSN